jgi:hydroxymethylglutaryl-CoA lyase
MSAVQGDWVTIRECGPRDGLQSESPLAVTDRARVAGALAAAGLREVEAVSFVSPTAVPAMAGAAEVAALLPRGDVVWWALVPNVRGCELALQAGFDHLTVTVSASSVYSEKNIRMSIADSLAQVSRIREVARDALIDAVVSFSFGSPYADGVHPGSVAAMVADLRAMGVDRVTLADTSGAATPRRIAAVLEHTGPMVGLHLHDTRATALTNAYAGYGLGVRRFDTAIGGLGGSPFAPGAGGNLATEDLVLLFDDLGIDTGVELESLLHVGASLSALIGRPLPSRVAAAGGLPLFDV